jgi:hypothetical protein
MRWIKLFDNFNTDRKKIEAAHYVIYLWAISKFLDQSGYATLKDQYEPDVNLIMCPHGLFLKVRQLSFHTGTYEYDKQYVSDLLCIPEKFGDARDNWEYFFAGGTEWDAKKMKYESPYHRAKLEAAKLYIEKNNR